MSSSMRVALLAMLPILLVDAQSMAAPIQCLPGQAAALLQLKRSFDATVSDYFAAFRSWVAGTDCCHWDGVRCGGDDGRAITFLDLRGHQLQADVLDTALFSLTSLEYLDISSNDFSASKLPATGFELLAELTHLDISDDNFAGQVPAGIGHLTNLVYLDLSTSFLDEELDEENSVLYYTSYSLSQLSEPSLDTLLANLTNLQDLRLGMVDMSSNGARWCDAIARFSPKLQIISMPYCSLSGPICRSFSALKSLVVIELHYNYLSGPIPEFLAHLSNLSGLQLSNNNFEGWFPPIVFQHKKLRGIDLSKNFGISGNLPNFSADSNLQSISVSNTNFSGTIPSSIINLKSLKELALGASGFSGVLPSSIGKLKSLDLLEVSGLQLLGSIPSWISNLTSLNVLKFFHCGLSGPVPSSIVYLTKLTDLALYNCHFSGEIATLVSNLTQLETLLLHSNNFVGTVELASFSKLQNMSVLNLSNNKLVVIDGENSSSAASYSSISFLRLSSCSISSFPTILRHLPEITSLDLSYNQIRGAIPQWVWKTSGYFSLLNLSHNKFTSTGSDPLLPLNIEFFDLSFNKIEGVIPIPQKGSITLDYSNNQFSSMPLNFSTYLKKTIIFKASKNNLSGNIPPLICDGIKSLQLIDLSNNYLTGIIPSCLMEDASALQVLSLKENNLTGELPDNIKEGCALSALDFSGNLIQGKLPRSLVACRNLEILDIGNNQISDSFPCWMSKLPQLQVLVLKSNRFIGQMDISYTGDANNCQFTKLRIADIASNNFSGMLPEEWFKMLKSMMTSSDNGTSVMESRYYHGQTYQFTAALTYKGNDITISKILTSLVLIDVSNNDFHGSIPSSIGELALLHGLNMSRNMLTGPIPTQFGNLNNLESLDLSSNKLSNEIPEKLASLNFLATLNLSYNMLAGRIPQSSHFSTFSNASFEGNIGLCGAPLSKQCSYRSEPNIMPHASKKDPIDVLLFLFTGLGFGVCFGITILVIWGSNKRNQQA
ncbi:Os12g0218500 [Oryza sativa Japonica Group]|uniref:non-specific serine/threonine protein kinase n=3 Tax=Oryza sativa subsp. japonica TaxID=39947 RepID=A3AL91_ORYSJ|nr:Leucine Rich Repeat family protein [Oryza sativa Japonica Group]EAZ28080.1 hypothetical protein OsJ_12044 [Oryza sativa Japonica Group]BAH95569.1 Os12g0218500 [Oryza sativa Japonica Group]|eukprot:NP_001176841.1 Os12g0218500 [Oryza sativa Japonica Group]